MAAEIIAVRGHYEVYLDGKFYCSADTPDEAEKEIETYEMDRDFYDDLHMEQREQM